MTTGSRLASLGQTQMTESQRGVAQTLAAGPRGGIVGPYHAWLRQPELASRALRLGDYCRFDAEIERDVAELAILVAGRYWDASFEFAAHAPLAAAAGVEPEVIEAIRTGARPALRDPRLEVVYDLLTEWYRTHRVGDTTYQRACDVLGAAAVVDVVAVAGYYALVCMTLNVFEVPLPDGVADPLRPHPTDATEAST